MKPLLALALSAPLICVAHPVIGAASSQVQRAYPIHYHYNRLLVRPMPAGAGRATTTLPLFNVTYHGGPIQPATASYTIFWQPAGTFMSPRYKQLTNRFLNDVGGSPIYGIATSYFGANGRVRNQSHLGSTWTDRTPYPASLQTDPDTTLQKEIVKIIKRNGWHAGLSSQFFIFTAKDAIPVQNIPFCAYHSAFNATAGWPVVYSFVPYVGYLNGCDPPYGITPNNDVDADGNIISVSHEQMEMVTDPLPTTGWIDDKNGEIGDLCIDSFGVPYLASGGNLDINGHPYFLQEEYSQARGACLPNL